MEPDWRISIATSLVLLAGALGEAAGQVQLPRFVPDVVRQFNDLSERPDAMGFELRGPDPSACRHHQAIVRTEAADGTPYFIVSRSGILPPLLDCPYQAGGDGSPTSNLYIIRMGSRDKHGERLRSNRLRRDLTTSDTPPDQRDGVVRSIAYDGTEAENYGHPGGMQLVGNILALALEKPQAPGLPSTMIQFLDVGDPENPRITSRFTPTDRNEDPLQEAGVVGITACAANRPAPPCAAGHYLMVITGGNNAILYFYESTSGDLGAGDLSWILLDTFEADHGIDCTFDPVPHCTPRRSPDEVYLGADWPDYHQSLQFLRERDLNGTLYVAGALGHFLGDDYIYLYRVDFVDDQIRLAFVSQQHKISHPAGEGEDAGSRLANFGAASTFHVTPGGELLFYATEHDNDGPDGSNGRRSVKMGEWRDAGIVRPGSPTLLPTADAGGPYAVPEGSPVLLTGSAGPPATRAWIQLFELANYQRRNVVIDYDDRAKDDFNDFRRLDPRVIGDVNGASDEASSWRWFAPTGCTIRANDDDFDDPAEPPGPNTRTLTGTGRPKAHPDLTGVASDAGTLNIADSFTSVQFFPDCDAYYAAAVHLQWDLDLDGIPDAAGSPASYSAVEGPAVVTIEAQATHSTDGRTGVARATITISNVAPSIDSAGAFDAAGRPIGSEVPFVLERRPISIRSTFSDPGSLDHQFASLNWGDGPAETTFDTFTDAFGGVPGQLLHHHAYVSAGDYDIVLEVTDDDQGRAQAVVLVTVLSPVQAVARIIDLLDAVIASTVDETALKHLQQARKALAGEVIGFGNDGALHKLEERQTAAALAHLENALTDLARAQEAGADVATAIALIREVAAVVSSGS
jgi:hypothetical protein